MSNREQAIAIINQIPEYKMDYIVAFLRGFQLDDEIEVDIFCERMYQDYLNNSDPEKDDCISIEEFAKESGIELS